MESDPPRMDSIRILGHIPTMDSIRYNQKEWTTAWTRFFSGPFVSPWHKRKGRGATVVNRFDGKLGDGVNMQNQNPMACVCLWRESCVNGIVGSREFRERGREFERKLRESSKLSLQKTYLTNTILCHLQYHPNDPSSSALQQAWREKTCSPHHTANPCQPIRTNLEGKKMG
jgi:hypothetical protein